uniref:Glycoprotein-N-acetylgalactosamine 3-beta-galactosyltransferase 1 n=1 Tax=Ascaris lumbricoides TaxID=6252 RepID=A0A0M3I6X0_ASCLU
MAKYIGTQVSLLCMITTTKENHLSKARHIAATWVKRCTKYIFISSETDLSLPSIHFDVPEGHENLWGKTRAAFKYAYDFHFDQFDWFLKADDDTYVIIENLRLFLLTQRPDEPVYLGCRFKKFVKGGYMQGGAGYVISRSALKAFAEKALPDAELCQQGNRGDEDVEMGRCLQNVGVRIIDSRDSTGHHRFLALHPLKYLTATNKTTDFWISDYSYDNILQGPECCSKYAIAFHYMKPEQLYLMEYLIYHLNVYGLREEVNTQLEREEAITKALSLSASLNLNNSIETITPDPFGDSSS